MLMHRTAHIGFAASLILSLALSSWAVGPVGSAFTYQGLLNQSGQPLPDGSVVDLKFSLWDGSGVTAAQIGTTQDVLGMTINDGLVKADLDFGAAAFNGQERWLEIALRSPAGSGSYTTLSPRQPLTAAPYANYSLGPWQTSGADLFYTAGKVGIGTSTPGTSLQVAGGIRAKAGIPFPVSGNNGYSFDTDSSTGLFSHDSGAVQLWTSSVARITIDNTGRVGIGTVGPVNKLSVNGIANITTGIAIGLPTTGMQLELGANSAGKPTSNTWTVVSDARLKKNIAPIDGALDQLMQLRGVTYQWIDPASQGNMAGTYTGMIAQDVEKVFPEWVGTDANGYKNVTVIGFEGLAVEALRQLRAEKDAQIKTLQSQVDDLKSELDGLKALVSRLAADRK